MPPVNDDAREDFLDTWEDTSLIRSSEQSRLHQHPAFSHDALEVDLRDRSLWSDALTPVLLPKGIEGGRATKYSTSQFRPPERTPSLRRDERQLELVFDDAEIYHEGLFLDARIWHE